MGWYESWRGILRERFRKWGAITFITIVFTLLIGVGLITADNNDKYQSLIPVESTGLAGKEILFNFTESYVLSKGTTPYFLTLRGTFG